MIRNTDISASESPGPLAYWPTINALYHQRFRQSGLVIKLFSGRGEIDEKLLSDVLLILQARHPSLNCRLAEEGQTYVLNRAPVGETVRLECLSTTNQSAYDVAEQLMAEDIGASLWRIALLRSPTKPLSWSLIMLCHHAICDAQSMAEFLMDLLTQYVAVSLGQPVTSEPLTMQPAPAVLDASGLGAAPNIVGQAVETEWPIEQPAPLEQRRGRWLKVPVDPNLLENLLRACRREQVSVTNLLTAALLRSKGFERCARVTTAVDFRRRVEPPIGTEHFGCYIGMLESAIPWADDIWDYARNCAAFQLRNMDRILLARLSRPLLEKLMTDRISKGLDNRIFAGGCAVSNLGVVSAPDSLGPLSIDEIQFTTRQVAGLYSVFLAALSHAGKLRLSLSYAEPLISAHAAEKLATRISEQLTTCCINS